MHKATARRRTKQETRDKTLTLTVDVGSGQTNDSDGRGNGQVGWTKRLDGMGTINRCCMLPRTSLCTFLHPTLTELENKKLRSRVGCTHARHVTSAAHRPMLAVNFVRRVNVYLECEPKHLHGFVRPIVDVDPSISVRRQMCRSSS